jgi:hypothetical protein
LIVDDIVQTFPEARFIFLWRNPLAVVASMLEAAPTSWIINEFHVDLVKGLPNLIRCAKELGDRCVEIKYEELVREPELQLRKVMKYLGLEYENDLLAAFDEISFKGSFGDQWGTKHYHQIDPKPIEKWRTVLTTPLRKWWCGRYLDWISEPGMGPPGYDIRSLREELQGVPISVAESFRDLPRLLQSVRTAIGSRSGIRSAFRSPPRITKP